MCRHTLRVRAGNDRASLYTEITDKIIAELEAGRIPWVQPWGTAAIKAPLAMPRDASTRRGYSGINALILWGAVIEGGFSGQTWLTFRQALGLGGHVRKGEQGTTVVYADRFTPQDERRRAAETGREPGVIPFLKRFTVFNTDQCDGLPEGVAALVIPPPPGQIEPQAEALIAATGAAALTAGCAVTIYLVAPEAEPVASGAVPVGLRKVYADPRFWRLAPLSATCVGTTWSLQGLWAARWLTDVEGLDRADVVQHLFAMAVALSLGAILFGVAADRLRRRGVGPQMLLALVATVFITAQLELILRLPLPSYFLWVVVAAVGAATVLSFAILADYFPKQLAGRANGALNLFRIAAAFAVQYLTGVVLAHWTLRLDIIPKSPIRRPSLSTSRFRSWHGSGSCFPRVRIDSRQKLTPEPCSNLRPGRV